MIEYKIISESSGWGFSKVRKKIEAAINEHTRFGWRVVSISFTTGGTYYGFATLKRLSCNEEFV